MQKLYSLRYKLLGFGALVIIVTASLIFGIGYRVTKKAIIEEAQKQVMSVARERQARLNTWLDGKLRSAEAIALSHTVHEIYENYQQSNRQAGSIEQINLDQLYHTYHHDQSLLKAILFDNNENIIVMAAQDSSSFIDTSRYELQRALSGESVFGPIHLNRNNIPVINFTTHIHDSQGQIRGMFFSQFATAETVDPILADTSGLGHSGEAFLVNQDTVMITPSRFQEHPMHLTHKMPIPTVLEGLQGKTGTMVYTGFLGEKVVGAYTFMPVEGWVLVVEMKIKEAFQPLREIIHNTLLATIVALIGLLLLTSIITRAWTSKLEQLAKVSEKVGAGDYSVRLGPSHRNDEIGVLVRVFNKMIVGIAKSQEQLKQSHLKLLQSEKLAAIGGFVASIVHEMRNPLSSIKMNLRLLERKARSEAKETEYITIATEEVNRLERMFEELLDYSKPPVLQLEVIDPTQLMLKAVQSSQELANAKSVYLSVEKTEATPDGQFQCDPDKILRVLANVIQNAIQASHEKSEVTISILADHPSTLSFVVRDQGSGMSEKALKRVFEPFFTSRDDGIGLGMNNVKKFIDAHHGELEIESEQNVGTTVKIILPKEIDDGENTGH